MSCSSCSPSFVASGAIPVDLPKASHATAEPERDHIITIDKQGIIYLDSIPVSLSVLKQRLEQIDHASPIKLMADRSITVQSCVDVLDLVSAEGFKKVSLQTERGTDK